MDEQTQGLPPTAPEQQPQAPVVGGDGSEQKKSPLKVIVPIIAVIVVIAVIVWLVV
jgi:hypothetical protein